MEENEVDLRDYLGVIAKRRWIIVAVFLAAVIASGLISFLLPAVYKATATLMVTKPKYEVELEPKFRTLFHPEFSIETYRNLIKTRFLEERVTRQLKLDQRPEKLMPEKLDDLISVEEIKNTNLIELSAEADSPKLATEIANTLAELFVAENEKLNLKEMKESQAVVKGQLKVTEEKLDAVEEQWREFQEKNRIPILEGKIESRIKQIIDYEKKLSEIERSLLIEEATLKQVREVLKRQDKVLVLTKSIVDDQFLHRLSSEIAEQKAERLCNLRLSSEQLNPIYQNLKQREVNSIVSTNALRAEEHRLRKDIDRVTEELNKFKPELANQKLRQAQLTRVVDTARSTYDILSQKAEEARISVATKPGLVKIVTYAFEPEKPIKPKKRLNISIAAIIGLIGGLFMAFGIEYFEKGKSHESEKNP